MESKAGEIIDKYFSYNEFDRKRVCQSMEEYNKLRFEEAIKEIEEIRGFKVNERKAVDFCIQILKSKL